jgi:hypothetical protein
MPECPGDKDEKGEKDMRSVQVGFALTVFVMAAPAADLFVGTWKADPTKSTNNWGQRPPQKMTRTYTTTPDGGYDVKIEGVDGDGKSVSTTLKAAGNIELPITNSTSQGVKALGATHVKSRRVNDRKLVATYFKDGKPVGTSTSTVSADGRTLTMKFEGTGSDGKKLMGTNVYEKQ